jgi:hypothetical protein
VGFHPGPSHPGCCAEAKGKKSKSDKGGAPKDGQHGVCCCMVGMHGTARLGCRMHELSCVPVWMTLCPFM